MRGGRPQKNEKSPEYQTGRRIGLTRAGVL